ncbi:Hypothetical predicted protein [Marmota monax]|uniref:Uncharacterized protein n=1 Tax=Marmota monax TaxID=9995 RepID=A0A5E4C6D6_MARMO|nr:Hypothetical predicted protein [Marmota monax]
MEGPGLCGSAVQLFQGPAAILLPMLHPPATQRRHGPGLSQETRSPQSRPDRSPPSGHPSWPACGHSQQELRDLHERPCPVPGPPSSTTCLGRRRGREVGG